MPTQNQTQTPLGLFDGRPTPRLYDATVNILRVHHYSRPSPRQFPPPSKRAISRSV